MEKKQVQFMNKVIEEVTEYLENYDIEPTRENKKRVLTQWINNLYSHIGIEAHLHAAACGVIDKTGMSFEEQDKEMLRQIEEYKKCLTELG